MRGAGSRENRGSSRKSGWCRESLRRELMLMLEKGGRWELAGACSVDRPTMGESSWHQRVAEAEQELCDDDKPPCSAFISHAQLHKQRSRGGGQLSSSSGKLSAVAVWLPHLLWLCSPFSLFILRSTLDIWMQRCLRLTLSLAGR